MKEALDEIKTAESKTVTILEEAKQESKVLILNATQEVERMIQEARKRGDEQGKSIIQKAKSEAKKEAEALSKEYEQKIEQLKQRAAGKLSAAEKLLMERTVKAHGNC